MTQIAHDLNIKVQHCYREGNETADALAKFGANSQMSIEARIFSQVCELVAEARGAYCMDRAQFPCFRIRLRRYGTNSHGDYVLCN